jgi:hypothetical protein
MIYHPVCISLRRSRIIGGGKQCKTWPFIVSHGTPRDAGSLEGSIMAIQAKCPNPSCGKVFNLKTELIGKTVKCDACQQPFTVSAGPHV